MSSDHDLVRVYPPSVILEDDPAHVSPYYFCTDDPDCLCHDDQTLLSQVESEWSAGLLTPQESSRIVQGRQVNSRATACRKEIIP